MKQLLTFYYKMYTSGAWPEAGAVASVWRRNRQNFELGENVFGPADFQIAPPRLRTRALNGGAIFGQAFSQLIFC